MYVCTYACSAVYRQKKILQSVFILHSQDSNIEGKISELEDEMFVFKVQFITCLSILGRI